MKYTDIKIGDIVTVLIKPDSWASILEKNCPLDKSVTYPYTGIVYNLKDCGTYFAAKIGDYGFSIDSSSFKFKIEKLNYEIY